MTDKIQTVFDSALEDFRNAEDNETRERIRSSVCGTLIREMKKILDDFDQTHALMRRVHSEQLINWSRELGTWQELS